jgi:hypothetical protein
MKTLSRKSLNWTAEQLQEIRDANTEILRHLSLGHADDYSANLTETLSALERNFSIIKARVEFEKRQILSDLEKG